MAVTAGIGGSVSWNSVALANLDNWTLSIKGAIVKTTAFGATGSWDTNTPTIKSWTATAAGRLDPADTTGQLILLNGLGTTMTLQLSIGSNYWQGTAIITGLDPKASTTTTDDVTFTFQGTGPCTMT